MRIFSLLRKWGEEILMQTKLLAPESFIERLKLACDMNWCILRYGARPIDYARFEFVKKRSSERNRYLTFFRYFKLLKKLDPQICDKLSSKKLAEYQVYRKYIKRGWISVDQKTTVEILNKFFKKYPVAIVKPATGEQGHGIYKVTVRDIEKILEIIKQPNASYLLEEVVKNAPELEIINPSSLNTIRAYTIIDKTGKIHILAIMLRAGAPHADVDNWGSGGVGYNFDLDTGICVEYGRDKRNKPYIYHPGTNIQMVGYKLPNYAQLLNYIHELASVEVKAKFVGWDIAITPNGYELIEMNLPGGHDFLQAFGTPYYDKINALW